MTATVMLGAQWGDEGKGKSVDILAEEADAVARFQGGPNAGHTLVVNGRKTILNQIPSGILHPKPICILGNGMVVDPVKFLNEIETLETLGLSSVRERIRLARNAHIILPLHREMDALMDEDNRVGTTKKGIGPAYADKKYRIGLRVSDILSPNFEQKVWERTHDEPRFTAMMQARPDFVAEMEGFYQACQALRPFICDTVGLLLTMLDEGKSVLIEGAQGTFLDIDHGSYPFVTSSNTTIGGVCTGLGIPASAITRVIGIAKAYTTRVGTGPFPTELRDDLGKLLQERGQEFGAVSGRPRRCGWFDAPLTRLAIRMNGITELWMTKLDILDTLPEIKVCVGYIDRESNLSVTASGAIDHLESVTPVYEILPGWEKETRSIRHFSQLPRAAQQYIEFIEESTGVSVTQIGVGPDRDDCVSR